MSNQELQLGIIKEVRAYSIYLVYSISINNSSSFPISAFDSSISPSDYFSGFTNESLTAEF
jgi:hypothetical protein